MGKGSARRRLATTQVGRLWRNCFRMRVHEKSSMRCLSASVDLGNPVTKSVLGFVPGTQQIGPYAAGGRNFVYSDHYGAEDLQVASQDYSAFDKTPSDGDAGSILPILFSQDIPIHQHASNLIKRLASFAENCQKPIKWIISETPSEGTVWFNCECSFGHFSTTGRGATMHDARYRAATQLVHMLDKDAILRKRFSIHLQCNSRTYGKMCSAKSVKLLQRTSNQLDQSSKKIDLPN